MKWFLSFLFALSLGFVSGQTFNGVESNLGNLYKLSPAKSRSIGPENFNGAKGAAGKATTGTGAGAARELGQGWKLSPSVDIKAGETFTIAEIEGPGSVQHIWMTPTGNWRFSILRFYWDDEATPSVEVPVGDFFGMGWGQYAPITSLPVCVNPGSAFNCYWPMVPYYQVDYLLTEVPSDAAYFHAQFRRTNPLPYKQNYTLLDSVKGKGQYVGTYLAWGVYNNGWWGAVRVRRTISAAPTTSLPIRPMRPAYRKDIIRRLPRRIPDWRRCWGGDGHYTTSQRFGLYRWHITDPVRFDKNLKVTIQALGWRDGGRYLPLQDDISSTVFWYQADPHGAFPRLPSRDQLEVN